MHTTHFQFKDQTLKNGRFTEFTRHFYVIHNGDWSGDAEVVEVDASKPETSKDYVIRKWEGIPGALLEKIGAHTTANKIISMIEGEFL